MTPKFLSNPEVVILWYEVKQWATDTARGGGTPSAAGSFAYTCAGTDTESGLTNYA
jgi:hypothetical protein